MSWTKLRKIINQLTSPVKNGYPCTWIWKQNLQYCYWTTSYPVFPRKSHYVPENPNATSYRTCCLSAISSHTKIYGESIKLRLKSWSNILELSLYSHFQNQIRISRFNHPAQLPTTRVDTRCKCSNNDVAIWSWLNVDWCSLWGCYGVHCSNVRLWSYCNIFLVPGDRNV